MNKKLLAVAVAGVFAAPVAALAQSSVTIGGTLKGGFENYSLGNSAKNPKSQSGVVDDSSSLVFTVNEDLGNGLRAEGRLDNRIGLDTGAIAATGNTHLGLVSKQWGTLFFGRQDLHYFNNEDYLATKGSLRGNSVSLLAYVNGAGSNASQSIANATRTTNVVYYKTPDFGPFWMIVAYSANPFNPEADINSGIRRGSAWNLNPNFSGQNWQVGYSYWQAKQDNAGAVGTPANAISLAAVGPAAVAAPSAAATAAANQVAGDQRGDRLYGSYLWNGFRIGLAWDKSRVKQGITGVVINNRTTWSIPMSYNWGNNTVFAHFDRAGNDRAAGFAGLNTKANMFAVAYAYDLSKRTSVALTYARINNGANANYNLFTATSLGVGVAPAAGEKPTLLGITMRHAY